MNIDYVAGFLDGDGHISLWVRKNYRLKTFHFTPSINFSQKNKFVLEKIKEYLNMGYITNHGNGYTLHITNKESVKRLVSLLDGKLIAKQEELDILKEYLALTELGMRSMASKETLLKLLYLVERISEIGKHKPKKIARFAKIKEWIESLPDNRWEVRSERIREKLKGRRPSPKAFEALVQSNKERAHLYKRDEQGRFVRWGNEYSLSVQRGDCGSVVR